MKKIIIKFTNEEARNIKYYLRKRYNTPKKQLVGLCKWAIFRETALGAKEELELLEGKE